MHDTVIIVTIKVLCVCVIKLIFFEQWPLCNKCKIRHLGDCNDASRCYNCGRVGHLATDYQNCHNCGKLGHLTKDCLNCYNCGKHGHFARDCPKQEQSNLKQGNARVYALTQGEAEVGTSQVVAGQISVTHTCHTPLT